MFFPDAARILGIQLYLPEPSSKINGASIDTRTLQAGNFFVALPGTNVDGHQFLDTAFQKGASGALVQESFWKKQAHVVSRSWRNLLAVPDPAAAFLKLAACYRASFALSATVGIVGSVGKTSTKEFLYYLLRPRYPTLATEGNLNNHLGLPLTLFKLNPSHRFCVCELGTNKIGDVRELAEVLKPDHGLLTQIAPEHLEGFGSMENIYKGELELFESLRPGSAAVLPDDDPILLQKTEGLRLQLLPVGATLRAAYRLSDISAAKGRVHFKVNGRAFSFSGNARFLARNAALAIAMAEVCGIKINEMPEHWEGVALPKGRFQEQIFPPGVRVIYDGYNASPASFDAALQTFEEMNGEGRKILVFSDMLELGPDERRYHEALGRRIAALSLDRVVAYGPRSHWSVEILRRENPALAVDYVEGQKEAAAILSGQLQKGDALLLKASRGMKVEEVLNHLFESNTVTHQH